MFELIGSSAGVGATSYLMKLAVDYSISGLKVLLVSPEYSINNIRLKLYAYKGCETYIDKNIDILALSMASNGLEILLNHIRGRETYDAIIVDCFSMLVRRFDENRYAIDAIKSRTPKLICSTQLYRNAIVNNFNSVVESTPSGMFEYAKTVKLLTRMQEPTNNGFTSIMNVFSVKTLTEPSSIKYLESYIMHSIKKFGVKLELI